MAEILASRAPHGARGLKPHWMVRLPKRFRRAPHGARGLKQKAEAFLRRVLGRAPHGARGLKLLRIVGVIVLAPVAPHTGRVD